MNFCFSENTLENMSLDFGIVICVNEALRKKGIGDYIATMKSK